MITYGVSLKLYRRFFGVVELLGEARLRGIFVGFFFFYRMAMFQSQEVVSEVLPFGALFFLFLFTKYIRGTHWG